MKTIIHQRERSENSWKRHAGSMWHKKHLHMKSINKIILVLIFIPFGIIKGQNITPDSLTLQQILSEVMANYPSLKKINQELVSADAKIGLTKTAYLPDINFSGSYSRVGPTNSITMPINGSNHTFSLLPENVYSAGISVNENIYDFGKTAKNISLDQKNKEMIQISIEQAKQRLTSTVIASFYSIGFLQEAIKIKDEQLKTFDEHLQYVQKKAATGSATQYDIMSTKVRISAIENQKTDLLSALEIQTGLLNSLLDKSINDKLLLKKVTIGTEIIPDAETLYAKALSTRPEMKIALQKSEIAKSRFEVVKAQNNPSFNFLASGGFKNGYFDQYLQDVGKLNFAVGVGFKMPIFDANRTKFIKIQTNSEIESCQHETELTKRNISNEVLESRTNIEAAIKKVKQSELQLIQAEQAYNLAEVSYRAGSITNLDLMDSYTALSESKLMLFKTKIDYAINLQKLKIATGEKLYE